MRILHVDTGTVLRGGQELLLLTASGLRELGHAQTIACPEGSALQQAALAAGFEVLATPADDHYYLRTAVTIRRRLQEDPHDIVHAHDAHGLTAIWLASLGLRVKRVAGRQVIFKPRNLALHRWKYTRMCDRVVASSAAVRATLVKNGIPAGHVATVTGGIRFPERMPGADARERMRAEWGLAGDDFVLGHVAAFTAEKGQREALDALLMLLPRHPRMRLLLLGEGPLRQHPAMLERLGRTGAAAQAPGYYKPGPDFYAGLDLALVNSTSEALGLSAIYAMAYGLPVIASNVGGLPTIVTSGETGWLVPPGDAPALARTIAEAASDPERLRRYGLQARESARRFSISATAERMAAVYQQLLRDE